MYLVERFVSLYQISPDSTNGKIAFELFMFFRTKSFPNVKEFCRLASISRASLHRFVSESGFFNGKDLIHSLEDDLKRNEMALPKNS